MNAAERQAARELVAKATPGPWSQGMVGDRLINEVDNAVGYGFVVVTPHLSDDGAAGVADAAFIADSITLLPAALDALDERDAAIEALRQSLWDIYAAIGCDTDGDPTPAAVMGDLGAMVLREVSEYRSEVEAESRNCDATIARLVEALRELEDAYEDACWQGSGEEPLSFPTWHNFTSSWEDADELIPRMRALLAHFDSQEVTQP